MPNLSSTYDYKVGYEIVNEIDWVVYWFQKTSYSKTAAETMQSQIHRGLSVPTYFMLYALLNTEGLNLK